MRVAIVGAGISGLTAALELDRTHEVELFEANATAGGHAHTVDVDLGGEQIAIDTGFLVYNNATYPGLRGLLRELGVATQESEMSFSVECERCALTWSSRGLPGFLADRRNALRPQHWRFLLDLRRFHRDARAVLDADVLGDRTVGEYLADRRYGPAFARHFLRPLAACAWSTPPGDVDAFPLRFFLRFIDNHGMIGWGRTLAWRTVSGGSRRYVDAILARLRGRVQLDTAVTRVSREGNVVRLTLHGGETAYFDAVVLACHSDQALALLAEPRSDEAEALASIRYQPHRVVLHTDERLLPRANAAVAAWNFFTPDCGRAQEQLTTTYNVSRLQGLAGRPTFCLSLNPGERVREDAILAEFSYSHPQYDLRTLGAQQRLRELSGRERIYFAGAYLGYGFHEDGLQSGLRAVEQISGAAEHPERVPQGAPAG